MAFSGVIVGELAATEVAAVLLYLQVYCLVVSLVDVGLVLAVECAVTYRAFNAVVH